MCNWFVDQSMKIIMDLVIYGYIFIYIIQLSATCSGTKTMKRAVHFDDSFMSHDDSVLSLDSTSDAEYFPTPQKGHHLASINNLIGSVKGRDVSPIRAQLHSPIKDVQKTCSTLWSRDDQRDT